MFIMKQIICYEVRKFGDRNSEHICYVSNEEEAKKFCKRLGILGSFFEENKIHIYDSFEEWKNIHVPSKEKH